MVTHIVHIEYGIVAETGQYPEGCWACISLENKSWMAFQDHFKVGQVHIREHQKTARLGSYRANTLVGIEEEIPNSSRQ